MEKSFRKLICLLICIFWFAAIVLILRFFLAPHYPSYEREICTDIGEYMVINPYVEELLQSRYIDFLPDELQPRQDTKYYYDYSCDDRELHFTLYLEQRFTTEGQFQTEIVRLKSLPYKTELVKDVRLPYKSETAENRSFPNGGENNGIKYIIFDMPSRKKVSKYIGDTLVNEFVFSAARVDGESGKITYLLSYEYDNLKTKEVTMDFLNLYLEETGAIS